MFMAGAVGEFLRKNPGVGIRLVNDNWVALVSALRRRDLDFIVAAQPAANEATELATQVLSARQGYFLVRPGHPLASKRKLALADIAAWPIMCSGRLHPRDHRDAAQGAPRHGATRPIPDVACESLEMMAGIARATDHVLLSTLAASAGAIAAGELVALPLVEPRIGVTFAILRLAARTLPPIAGAMMREVVAADRAALVAERVLAARLFAAAPARPSAARPAGHPRRATVAARL